MDRCRCRDAAPVSGVVEQATEEKMADGQALGNEIRPTRNVVNLMTLIERIEARQTYLPGMAAFYGPSGYGKTFAAIHANITMNALHIEARDFWTRKSLCEALLNEMRVPMGGRATLSHLFDKIVEALIRDPRPLIIDEADHLVKKQMIEIVRAIHDATQNTVILIGEETLPQNLRPIERVHNRMADWVGAEPADLEDVRQLGRFYLRGIEIDDALLKEIVRQSRGVMRVAATNLGKVGEVARTRGTDRMTLADWDRGFFTGQAPLARRDLA